MNKNKLLKGTSQYLFGMRSVVTNISAEIIFCVKGSFGTIYNKDNKENR